MSDAPKSRQDILQDWLIGDTKELFETAKGLIAEGVAAQAAIAKAAEDMRLSGAASRDHAASVERNLAKHEERITSRLSGFESSLVKWANSTRSTTLVLMFGTVLIASLVGTIIGGMILSHIR